MSAWIFDLQPAYMYSKIPLSRSPKIKTNYPLNSIFKKFQSFLLCVFCTQCLLKRDHLWDCSKVVIKTTFEQSQKWSYYRNFTVLLKLNPSKITETSLYTYHNNTVLARIQFIDGFQDRNNYKQSFFYITFAFLFLYMVV